MSEPIIQKQELRQGLFRLLAAWDGPGRWSQFGAFLCFEHRDFRLTYSLVCEVDFSMQHADQDMWASPPFCNYLVVTDYLREDVFQQCRQRGISCVDLSGRCIIAGPGCYIEKPPKTLADTTLRDPEMKRLNAPSDNPKPAADSPLVEKLSSAMPQAVPVVAKKPLSNQLWERKTSRIARMFLHDPLRKHSLTSISHEAGVSLGMAYKVMLNFRRLALVKGGAKDWQVYRLKRMAETWHKHDKWCRRVHMVRYYAENYDWERLTALILEKYLDPNLVYFTQWAAANKRAGEGDVPILSFYSHKKLTRENLFRLGLYPCRIGGNVWLLESKDPQLCRFSNAVDGIQVVSDAQIFVDLMPFGEAGQSRAKAFMEWKGFCSNVIRSVKNPETQPVSAVGEGSIVSHRQNCVTDKCQA